MDENIALMLYGCKLAKDFEQNLPNLANQPDILLKSCEEIVRVFTNVRDRLIFLGQTANIDLGQLGQFDRISEGIQEWLRTGTSSGNHQAMDLLNAQPIMSDRAMYHDHMQQQQQSGLEFLVRGLSGGTDVGSLSGGGSAGEIKPPLLEAPDSNRASSSSQRQRRRSDEANKIVKRVAAPQMGNLDLPPEDGFTWRKYGQKEILGSRYPRSYYRCTHQKFYECPAKKQVQRLDHDPFTFEVTYRGTHTCHMSSTAPSAGAPPPEQIPVPPTTTSTITMPPPSLPSTTHWLSMQFFRDLGGVYTAGSSSGGGGGGGGGGVGGGRFPVVDMADAMFNSGSSSSNSLDLIFSSMDDKWDSEEKKD